MLLLLIFPCLVSGVENEQCHTAFVDPASGIEMRCAKDCIFEGRMLKSGSQLCYGCCEQEPPKPTSGMVEQPTLKWIVYIIASFGGVIGLLAVLAVVGRCYIWPRKESGRWNTGYQEVGAKKQCNNSDLTVVGDPGVEDTRLEEVIAISECNQSDGPVVGVPGAENIPMEDVTGLSKCYPS